MYYNNTNKYARYFLVCTLYLNSTLFFDLLTVCLAVSYSPPNVICGFAFWRGGGGEQGKFLQCNIISLAAK